MFLAGIYNICTETVSIGTQADVLTGAYNRLYLSAKFYHPSCAEVLYHNAYSVLEPCTGLAARGHPRAGPENEVR